MNKYKYKYININKLKIYHIISYIEMSRHLVFRCCLDLDLDLDLRSKDQRRLDLDLDLDLRSTDQNGKDELDQGLPQRLILILILILILDQKIKSS